MSHRFHVGQKIVCVEPFSDQPIRDEVYPRVGSVYTVRAIPSKDYLHLCEIVNTPRQYSDEYGEMRFWCARFRPYIDPLQETLSRIESEPVEEPELV